MITEGRSDGRSHSTSRFVIMIPNFKLEPKKSVSDTLKSKILPVAWHRDLEKSDLLYAVVTQSRAAFVARILQDGTIFLHENFSEVKLWYWTLIKCSEDEHRVYNSSWKIKMSEWSWKPGLRDKDGDTQSLSRRYKIPIWPLQSSGIRGYQPIVEFLTARRDLSHHSPRVQPLFSLIAQIFENQRLVTQLSRRYEIRFFQKNLIHIFSDMIMESSLNIKKVVVLWFSFELGPLEPVPRFWRTKICHAVVTQ